MKKIFLPLIALFTLILTSCSDKLMGYSVCLWTDAEKGIYSGEILPVYIKSNISHVYVIRTQNNEKTEIPLWQLTEPVKKGKIKKVVAKYEANARIYASVKLDGLPCRAEPVNTAKQVYRLRKGEVIKILYKGKGAAPMTGGKPLEGDWYKILTDDGTQGWCFSYNLNLFETDFTGARIGASSEADDIEDDSKFEIITKNKWYPDYFRSMIDSKNIDLAKMHPSYRFIVDTEKSKVSLNTSKIHQTWDYAGYTRSGQNEYRFKNIPIVLTYRNADYIVVRYTDETGKPQDLNFVSISESIADIINAEKDRRSMAYLQIWTHGPVYSSTSYGKLELNEDGTFRWTGFKLLVPSVIESGAKSTGSAQVKYSLSKALEQSYDGVLTMKFDGMSREVNFLYKLDGQAMRLEDASSAKFNGNTIVSRGTSPVIAYFKKI